MPVPQSMRNRRDSSRRLAAAANARNAMLFSPYSTRAGQASSSLLTMTPSPPALGERNRASSTSTSETTTFLARAPSPAVEFVPNPRPNFCTPQKFVTIIVDKDNAKQTFVVHKDVICFHSNFFATAFNSQFLEGKTQSMTLDDVEASIFGFFVHWLYTQKLENTDGKSLRLIDRAKLWVLAKRLLAEELATCALTSVRWAWAVPDDIADGGNTLQDFQKFAYEISPYQAEDTPLKEIAIEKTLKAINLNNKREVIRCLPRNMLPEFTEMLVEGCEKIPGWGECGGFGNMNSMEVKTSRLARAFEDNYSSYDGF